MVLENSSARSSDDFTDDAPISDSDPYSSSLETPNPISIDASRFPRPIPIVGRLFGFNDQLLSKFVFTRIETAQNLLQRPVTEPEATAIAYWTAKQVSLISYGGPIGIAGGAWRAYNTAGTFRLPFHQPNLESFKSDVWPAARVALLTGPRAFAAWHACRLLAYGVLGKFFGKLLFTSYAMSVSAVGESTDPRLKDYVQAIRKAAQTARGRLPNEPRRPGAVDGVQQKDASALWRDHRRGMDDNASPTIGGSRDTESADVSVPLEGPRISDQNSQIQGTRPQANPREHKQNLHQDELESPTLDDPFDDASSSSGSGVESTGAAGASAWDRIRRQTGSQPAGNRRSSSPSSKADLPSPPSHGARMRDRDRDRDLPPARKGDRDADAILTSAAARESARERAQQEFDARVEQERRGGDFSAEGEQKRW